MTATPAPLPSGDERKPVRIPSLDGLRALSIALVLLAHLNGTHGFGISHAALLDSVDWGTLGVRVFFVLSGFLITGLLSREIARTNTVDLRHFYFRRTMRIFPAYYAFIAAVIVADALGGVHLRSGDLLAAVTYTMNYHEARGWSLGHTWSLAVEEQFYLIWPVVLYFSGMRRGLWIALGFICLAPVIRIGLLAAPGGATGLGFRFETVADAIAAGCVLALLQDRLWSEPRYRSFLRGWQFGIVPIALAAALAIPVLEARHALGYDKLWVGAYNFAGITTLNIAIALCVDWAIFNETRVVGRLLNWGPLAFVGTMSYSIYLWQQPFLNRNQDHVWTRFPLNVALALACATISFFVVEQPALRARQAMERRWRARRASREQLA